MMQQFVDTVLAITKESVKTITYESLNHIVRLINGVSGLLLTIVPGKANILEIHGWELRPTFSGPRFPRWMENGVSSFNKFIHDLSLDSGTSSADYSSAEEDVDGVWYPSSPSYSQSSRVSTASRTDWYWTELILFLFWWIMLPMKFMMGIPFWVFRSFSARPHSPRGTHQSSRLNSIKKMNARRYHVIHRTTDRRRGVIEDLHLVIEIFIEAMFDFFHKAAHFLLSPSEVLSTVCGWFAPQSSGNKDICNGVSDTSVVPTATLGESDPSLTERNSSLHQALNTDARTCKDVITELGYPYEAIRVITSDGYVLLLERIPRRDSRKAVYFQHGALDSAMGWVLNGVVGSPAFAAYDQGFDVFLGNFRGLVSREHIDKNISSWKYWQYSLNELGTEDVSAMIEKIHEVKTAELKISQPDLEEETNDDQPYKLCAICHSMAGAALPMYVIVRLIEEKPHRLCRLILLSPAGFHQDSTPVFTILECLLILLGPILAHVIPAFYVPTRFFRMLLHKLARDFNNYPGVGGLVQAVMSYIVGGDSSNWVGVLGLPHYNMNDMPGVSFNIGYHFAQIKHAKKFRMFDYGSASANMEMYGSPEPLDLGEYYGLIDIPVDVVAGRKDNIIRPSMVRKHYELMKAGNVDVSYAELEYAHLDFTYSLTEELVGYLMSRLIVVEPPQKQQANQKASKLKRRGQATCQ